MSDKTDQKSTEEKKVAKMSEGKILASLDREALRSFFYLFSSRQDSRLKLFYRPITVTRDDLHELNRMMNEKLRLHEIEAVVSKVTITFHKRDLIEFSDWDSFTKYPFDEPDYITNLTAIWDLLFKLPGNPVPCRHTVTIKIAAEMSPTQVIHTIFSQDIDEIESFEINTVPCLVRVDFINTQLSDELIELVQKWNSGRRRAVEEKPLLSWLRDKKQPVATILHYLFPASISIAALVSLIVFDISGKFSMSIFGYWILASFISMFVS